MEMWQERVIEEKNQLDERLAKLSDYVMGAEFRTLALTDRELLLGQRMHMVHYSNVLLERIQRFNRPEVLQTLTHPGLWAVR